MVWHTLSGQGVRNLHPFHIRPAAEWNFVVGGNGAGKTAFLECLSILSTARSFRTDTIAKVISFDEEVCVVRGESSLCGTFGVQRQRKGGIVVAHNGDRDTSLKYLLEAPAFKIIEPDVIDSLDGGAEARRKALNWLMFHVEHSTRSVLRNYKRLLIQRNQLLKQSPVDLSYLAAFDKLFCRVGEQYAKVIQETFELTVQSFSELIKSIATQVNLKQFKFLDGLHFGLRPGWAQSVSFQESISRQLDSDAERGFTQSGPHRFDITVKIKTGEFATDVLSRGQLKLLSILWHLSTTIALTRKERPVVLAVDDLFAEFDQQSVSLALVACQCIHAQKFMTILPNSLEMLDRPLVMKADVFHVEHGRITAVQQNKTNI
ncbi:MAG: DNA replication/repair protein RecF [Gammaproteobacteria bacterium]|nr:MAG: DNA replication/repair protein RecF [Gammaproteobacteria bacterium]